MRLSWDDRSSLARLSFRDRDREAQTGDASDAQVLTVVHADDGHSSDGFLTPAAIVAPRPPAGPAPQGARRQRETDRLSLAVEGGDDDDDLDGIEKQIETSDQNMIHGVGASADDAGKEDVLAQAEAAVSAV